RRPALRTPWDRGRRDPRPRTRDWRGDRSHTGDRDHPRDPYLTLLAWRHPREPDREPVPGRLVESPGLGDCLSRGDPPRDHADCERLRAADRSPLRVSEDGRPMSGRTLSLTTDARLRRRRVVNRVMEVLA